MWIPKIDTRTKDLFEQWHPYWEWEEVKSNMWGTVEDRKQWLNKAIEFTGNHELYGYWMRQVVDQWPLSCRQALTKQGDKKSWIGHAAVALAIQCPEDIVRQAWGMLNEEQQRLANDQAENAIAYWRSKNQ